LNGYKSKVKYVMTYENKGARGALLLLLLSVEMVLLSRAINMADVLVITNDTIK